MTRPPQPKGCASNPYFPFPLECNTVDAGLGSVRITSSVEMATYRVTRLTALATSPRVKKDQTQPIIDCTYGVKAVFDAIAHEIYGPGGRPAIGTRTSLN